MDKTVFNQGRRLVKRIPAGRDLIASILSLSHSFGLDSGTFSVLGSVTSATIGVFDHTQEVYVTHLEKEATELLYCQGTVCNRDENPIVKASVILANQQGGLTGGRLFSDTIIHDAQIVLQELLNSPMHNHRK